MQDIWKFIKESDTKYEQEIQKALEKKQNIIKMAKEDSLMQYNNRISEAKKQANKLIKDSFEAFETYKKNTLEENIKKIELQIENAKKNIDAAIESGFREVNNDT